MIINRRPLLGAALPAARASGRSAQRGHCYLLYDKHAALSYDARRRLSAIIESSEELGAGFRIAMRDLEIPAPATCWRTPARAYRQRGLRPLHACSPRPSTRPSAESISLTKPCASKTATRPTARKKSRRRKTPALEIAPVTLDGTEQLTDLEGPSTWRTRWPRPSCSTCPSRLRYPNHTSPKRRSACRCTGALPA